MSHSISKTKIHFSGKFAIIAALLVGFAFTNQASADGFTQTQQAAVDQHFDILTRQQDKSDNKILNNQQQNFDDELEMAEDKFMTQICDEHGRVYDNKSQTCYEQ